MNPYYSTYSNIHDIHGIINIRGLYAPFLYVPPKTRHKHKKTRDKIVLSLVLIVSSRYYML